MLLANYKRKPGECYPVGRWIFQLEIQIRPPTMYRGFKPTLWIAIVKFASVPRRAYEAPEYIGFHRQFVSPIGFHFEWI